MKTTTTYTSTGMERKEIELTSEEQLLKITQDLAHVLHNLRFFTKYWNEHGGFMARDKMNVWQGKADALLDSLGLTLHNNISSVKVTKK